MFHVKTQITIAFSAILIFCCACNGLSATAVKPQLSGIVSKTSITPEASVVAAAYQQVTSATASIAVFRKSAAFASLRTSATVANQYQTRRKALAEAIQGVQDTLTTPIRVLQWTEAELNSAVNLSQFNDIEP